MCPRPARRTLDGVEDVVRGDVEQRPQARPGTRSTAMSRLTVSGHVRYNDLRSVTGATVRLRDLDGTDGHEDDRILTDVTDSRGRFSGRTTEWRDREGSVFGVDIPDILRLEFTVTVHGRTHTGPFLLHDGRSAPIVLPFGPPKPVTKNERELVQIILVSQETSGPEKALYEFIELASESLAGAILGGSYRRITTITKDAATLDGLVAALRAATGRAGIEAVDLLFTTHGLTDKVVFAEGKVPESAVLHALLSLPAAARRKLRMVFSTACFGRSHLDMWTAAGFTDASGARGVYADSAVSYAPFLTAWALEQTFAEAVDAANAGDVGDAADGVARAFYDADGDPDTSAASIDSTRVREGTGASRLYSMP
jgi:hypothetical protein